MSKEESEELNEYESKLVEILNKCSQESEKLNEYESKLAEVLNKCRDD